MKSANFITYIPDPQKVQSVRRCVVTMRKDPPLVAMWFVICIGALIIGVCINRDRSENEAGQNHKEGSLPTCPNKSVPGCPPSAMQC
jgi:hypothetical protein